MNSRGIPSHPSFRPARKKSPSLFALPTLKNYIISHVCTSSGTHAADALFPTRRTW